jgi:hypothetical protein
MKSRNEMGGTCTTYGGIEKYIQNFSLITITYMTVLSTDYQTISTLDKGRKM